MSEWISVDDRLPEEEQVVIVRGGCAIIRGGEWLTLMDEGWLNPRLIHWTVSHWMPLPWPETTQEERVKTDWEDRVDKFIENIREDFHHIIKDNDYLIERNTDVKNRLDDQDPNNTS